jgi:amino acid permease
MTTASRPRRFSWIAAPMLWWALHFVAVYSLQGLVCARGWSEPAGLAGIALLTLLAWAAVAWTGLHARRVLRHAGDDPRGTRFAARLATWLSVLSAVAIAYTVLPVVLLAPCK